MYGKKGISNIKLKDLKENFKNTHWECFKDKGKHHRIRTMIYWDDREFYRLNVFCVKRSLTRTDFIRDAVREKITNIRDTEKYHKRAMEKGSLIL